MPAGFALNADELKKLVSIALEAGKTILDIFSNPEMRSHLKTDQSPVSEADLAAEAVIARRLKEAFPNYGYVSEEDDRSHAKMQDRPYWLVDPLDGTKEFLMKGSDFTVNIALVADGLPVSSVVYAPMRNKLYFASMGLGAFQREGQQDHPIKTKAFSLKKPLFLVSKNHALGEDQILRAMYPDCEVKSIASSLKICLVAAGEADAVIRTSPTHKWDTAAADCILRCAGGRLLDWQGHSLPYADPTEINPRLIAVGGQAQDFLKMLLKF